MATREKIKKKKPSRPAVQVNSKEEKKDPLIVTSADGENVLDTTEKDKEVPEKSQKESGPVKYKKSRKKDPSIDGPKEKGSQEIGKGVKEKGTQDVDKDAQKEKVEAKPATPPSLSTPRERRSPSPFSRNVVEPVSGSDTNMGSATSLRSNLSAREAWTDRSESGTPTGKKKTRSSSITIGHSTSTAVSKFDKNGKSKDNSDAVSIESNMTAVHDGPEQHAYVPYLYARNSIMKIMEDMKNMKANHIRIVHDIEKHYRAIEDETQSQFNSFVICLRQQYSGKVKTFRQVIDVHRLDLQKKESYWNEIIASLMERNNKLLKDKKVLLIRNKVEIDRLEKEKVLLTGQLTTMVDKANASVSTVEKDYVGRIAILENEKKELLDETEKLKVLIAEQEQKISSLSAVAVATTAVAARNQNGEKNIRKDSESGMKVEKQAVLLAGAVAIGKDEKDQREKERLQIDGERQGITEERKQMDSDRMKFDEERAMWMNEINKLQAEISVLSKDSAEWQSKYETMKSQAEESATIHIKYKILENQYAALSAIVAATETSKLAAEENVAKSQEEKTMMEGEKKKLEEDIKKWEANFKKKNGRLPSDEDKTDSAKEMYTQLEEVNSMVESLDKKIDTLEHVKGGDIPSPPEVVPVPIVIKDPEVKTVEVKVPDPTVVSALEKNQLELSALQAQLSALQQEKSDLIGKVGSLNSDLSDSMGKIAELQAELAQIQSGAAPSAPVIAPVPVVSNAETEEKVASLTAQLDDRDKELERLRRENREMQKDMKKMLKRHEKLQAKLKKLAEFQQSHALLQAVVAVAQEIHTVVPPAAEDVDKRLTSAEQDLSKLMTTRDENQKSIDNWVTAYKKKNKTEPTKSDRDAEVEKLFQSYEDIAEKVKDQELQVKALSILQTGIIKPKEQQRPTTAARATPEKEVEKQLSALDDKVIDLESENESLKEDKTRLEDKAKELEKKVQELQELAALGSAAAAAPTEDLSEEVSALQKEIDSLNASILQEKEAHDKTKEELDELKKKFTDVNEELASEKMELEGKIDRFKEMLEAKLKTREAELAEVKKRKDDLENERLANVPVDTAKEIKNLQKKIALMEKEKSGSELSAAGLQSQLSELQTRLQINNKNLETQKAANRDLDAKIKAAKAEKEKAIRDMINQLEKKEQQRAALEKKVRQQEMAAPAKAGVALVAAAASTKGAPDAKALKDQLMSMKRENTELTTRIKHLENDARRGGKGDSDTSAADKNLIKRHEKILKELEKKYEIEKNKAEKNAENLRLCEEELKTSKKTCDGQEIEIKKLQAELAALRLAAKEGVEAAVKVKAMEKDVKKLTEENKVLTENFNSERVLRKKYYNMVEDMKGKIRVYCRARPLSSDEKNRGNYSIIRSPDEYSIEVQSQRGLKEFQFDQIFMEDSSQEKVFEDTNNLIQSAYDGYNVCIFAYGQTGSGKTFTMIGDREQKYPGIAPRAFNRIFDLAQENRSKFEINVTMYMLELYNDKLIDLFARPGNYDDERLDIKKDKKGMVFVQGSVVKEASNTKELFALFEEGSKNRHTASTKMNSESSRSHLIVGIVIESTNKLTGQVMKGKLSLVDLAGSERVAKTQAGAEQLKEAMSINKSLSALGDVISALSSEQSFIPYRNNKLTMVMQDSLGGNAKTLMFVNISPADYNTDESVISLTYASRVKLITNDASKNADNKEIAKLKAVIQKLKKGEQLDEEEATLG